jgi:hypothetical protein
MAKRNYVAYDKDYNELQDGDIVIFSDTEGTLHKKAIDKIVAKYVIPTDIPQCEEVRYSEKGLNEKRQPSDILLYIKMGSYLTPCVVSAKNTYKYFPKR